jgi:hypothetical protein
MCTDNRRCHQRNSNSEIRTLERRESPGRQSSENIQTILYLWPEIISIRIRSTGPCTKNHTSKNLRPLRTTRVQRLARRDLPGLPDVRVGVLRQQHLRGDLQQRQARHAVFALSRRFLLSWHQHFPAAFALCCQQMCAKSAGGDVV